MKIIARDQEEKEAILRLSRYLHDFRIYRSRSGKTVRVFDRYESDPCLEEKFYKLENEDLAFLELDDAVGNYLRHLYATPELIEVGQ